MLLNQRRRVRTGPRGFIVFGVPGEGTEENREVAGGSSTPPIFEGVIPAARGIVKDHSLVCHGGSAAYRRLREAPAITELDVSL